MWIQHLPCTQIIGHCYLRLGSELDPDLASALYLAILTALNTTQNTENEVNLVLSSVYGFDSKQGDGLGIFTVQSKKFRVLLLCEGFLGHGIPSLETSILKKVRKLFTLLDAAVPDDSCQGAHIHLIDESFWYDLVVASGLGGQLQIPDVITDVYPLRLVHLEVSQEENEILLSSMGDRKQASLGHGWQHLDQIIEMTIHNIYDDPHLHFRLYEALFLQMSEFQKEFSPNSLLLTFQQNNSDAQQLELVIFLSLSATQFKLQFCFPLAPNISLEGSQKVYSSFQQINL
jgi:hypothetical protein